MAAVPAAANDGFGDLLQPVFQSHCVQCHGKDGKVKGKVNLLELESRDALVEDPDFLETVLDVIDAWDGDADAVARVQEETGLVCMVGHTRRFNPSHQWVHRRIES